ncbi:hypothetical protein pb186bvf_005518 [Paramecium bursaria]
MSYCEQHQNQYKNVFAFSNQFRRNTIEQVITNNDQFQFLLFRNETPKQVQWQNSILNTGYNYNILSFNNIKVFRTSELRFLRNIIITL